MPSSPRFNPLFLSQITASDAKVRDLLAELRHWLVGKGFSRDACGTVEIVMAEALNNIVEHAYGGAGAGLVVVEVAHLDDHLRVSLTDTGHPLPGLCLPTGQLPASDVPVADLPEGGFGWFLIHRLTQRLTYQRQGNQNQLCFNILVNQTP